MSQGYAGRRFWIVRENVVLAAVRTKTATFSHSVIDRTDEEFDGWRHLDELPESSSLDCNVAGLAHPDNYVLLEEDWLGDTFTDIHLVFPDGTVVQAADGAFLRSLEYVGEVRGAVQFTAVFLFSGLISTVQPLLVTSRPYGIESTDEMTTEARALRGYHPPVTFEEMDVDAAALDGTLLDKLITYDAWPPEDMETDALALDGTIEDLAIVYDDWPPEDMDVDAAALDGTLDEILIRYTIEPEEMDVAGAALDSTLEAPKTFIVQDTFTDTDGTEIEAHSPDLDTGTGWLAYSTGNNPAPIDDAGLTIQGNRLEIANSVEGCHIDTGVVDHIIEFDWTLQAGDNRLMCKMRSSSDGANSINANLREPNGDIRISRTNNGSVSSPLTSTAFTFVDGETYPIKFVVSGDDYEIYVDDVLALSLTTAFENDPAHTYVALGTASISVSQIFDNFEVYT